MALTANKRLERYGKVSQATKIPVPATAGTFYIGEVVGVEPSSGVAKPISGSGEAGYQVIGVVTEQQVIAATGDKLEVEQGKFYFSGSGFTVDEARKIVYATDSSTMYDAHSAGRHAIGRVVFFSTTGGSNAGNNVVVDVGTVRSGTSA